jgi:ATP-dependent Clp protease ATP-binding subunit ClpC
MLGVKDWSEVEQRVRNLLKEIQQSRPVIFLDDVQGLGSREIAALHAIFVHATRGELSCIATTTPEGYERMGEESALRRLFQVVWVPEPTPEQTLAILQTLRPRYEEFHKVTIGDSMVTAIVEGAQSFSGTLPEKAIDVLDEACARVKVHAATPPPEVASLMREIESVRAEKDHAINNDEYERAAELRDRQMELEQRLQQKLKEGASAVLPQPTVTEEVVAQVIAERMSAQQKPGA